MPPRQKMSRMLERLSQSKLLNGGLGLIVLALVAVTALRVRSEYSAGQGAFDWENRGLSDFNNGIYYPTLAFRKGVSPYSQAAVEQFQMPRPAPPYSPVLFIVHWPLTWLPIRWAGGVYFLFNIGLLGVLARWGMTFSRARFRWPLFWISMILLLLSRPGHITLFTGYFTLEMIVGVMLALQFGDDRPGLSGLGVLLASAKPTYLIPLLLVMAFRRTYRALAWGIGLTILGAGVGIGWLSLHSSPMELIHEFQQTQQVHHADATEFPVNSWTRVDLLGLYAKWTDWVPGDRDYLVAMAGLLILPGISLWFASRRESNAGVTGLSGWIATLAILLTMYHHSYDCLLVVLPWFGLTFFGRQTVPELSAVARWCVVALVAVPAGNYLSTRFFKHLMGWESGDLIWQVITTTNGICLTLAWAILIVHGWKVRPRDE